MVGNGLWHCRSLEHIEITHEVKPGVSEWEISIVGYGERRLASTWYGVGYGALSMKFF